MNKYQFIKFGECVQWMDNNTNRYRTMQVSTPTPFPINDDTQINLIPAYESDCNDEECKSYSVKANELIPLITPFHKGYWCALQAALKNNAGTDIVSAMIQSSNFTYEECILMLQNTDTFKDKLEQIINTLYPEESNQSLITWNGKDYPSKRFILFKGTNDEQEVTVSVVELGNELIDDETGLPISDEAEELDNSIYYYLDEGEINLSDTEIIEIVENT